MNESKPCPTPRTNAAYRLGHYRETCFELERELIATQAALKECGEALQQIVWGEYFSESCLEKDMIDKSLSNPLTQQAMK